MRKVVIGIHGLGNKPARKILEGLWKRAIHDGLAGIGKYTVIPHFELVYWTDVLHPKPLVNQREADNMKKRKSKNGIPIISPVKDKVMELIEKQLDKVILNEDLSFNFSFISDFIIRNYFQELDTYYSKDCLNENLKKCKARDVIQERVISVLHKYKNDEIFLIAHSMGSIIVYDVLSYVLPNYNINTLVTMGSPLGLNVIKNKIAGHHKIELNENTKLKTPPGVVNKWINYYDELDSLSMKNRLSNNYAPNNKGVQVTDETVYNNYIYKNERNPHKSYGYLRTPELAQLLHNFLMRDKNSISRYLINLSDSVISRFTRLT